MRLIYLGFLFATDLVPTGTRSSAKKTSVNQTYFPNPGREYIYLIDTLRNNEKYAVQ